MSKPRMMYFAEEEDVPHLSIRAVRQNSGRIKRVEKMSLSLRGALSDEAISGFGQRLLRCARKDSLDLVPCSRALSHNPYE
jgi:hypothetical protein